MDDIFDNYFEVSELLRNDVSALLDRRDDDDPIWRRAFIRAVVPLIEGFAYSFLSICHANPELTSEERQKVDPNRKQKTHKRIMTALKSIHSQLWISPAPDFSGQAWDSAQQLFKARDALMHPKSANCLIYAESEWARLHEGAVWLLEQFFRVPDLLEQKFGSGIGIN